MVVLLLVGSNLKKEGYLQMKKTMTDDWFCILAAQAKKADGSGPANGNTIRVRGTVNPEGHVQTDPAGQPLEAAGVTYQGKSYVISARPWNSATDYNANGVVEDLGPVYVPPVDPNAPVEVDSPGFGPGGTPVDQG